MKEYFEPNAFPDMQQEGANAAACSSSSISPMDEEDPVLTFPSHASYFISSANSTFINEYEYYPTVGYNSTSSADNHAAALMYPEGHHQFMAPHGTFTTTPSPSSSISSSSMHNFAPGVMYYGVARESPAYNDMHFQNHHHHGESGPPTTTASSDFEFDQKEYDTKLNSCCSTSSTSSVSSSGGGHVTSATNGSPPGNYYRGSNNNAFGGRHPHRSNNNDMVADTSATSSSNSNKNNKDATTANKKPNPGYAKRQTREKGKKRCSNCHSTHSPSWRRSIAKHSKGDLLCNACGLYEKTAKKKRMLVTADDGNTKVVRKRDARDYHCSICGTKDVTRWRRLHDSVQCERCARGHRARI